MLQELGQRQVLRAAQPLVGVHMHEHVDHRRMALLHPRARPLGDVVTFRNADARGHADMRIDQCPVRHASRAQFVQALHPRRIDQRLPDAVHLFDRKSGVDQFLKCIPRKDHAHAHDHEADDDRGHGIGERETEEITADAHRDHQRRSRIRARVPGVGDQHRRTQALADPQHITKQALLRQ